MQIRQCYVFLILARYLAYVCIFCGIVIFFMVSGHSFMFTAVNAQDDSVPIRLSATIILVKPTAQGLKTLLMRRNSRLNFCGGFWVFPGGAVEEQDQQPDSEQTLRAAAVRETQEEAGVHIDADKLIRLSRWVTPQGAAKRFDTHFYLAIVNDVSVTVDGSEMVDSVWISAQEALDMHYAKDVELLPPTMISLMGLAKHNDIDSLMQHYQNRTVFEYFPKVSFIGEQLIMLYPGDAGYDSANAEQQTIMHRCLHVDSSWHYINDIDVVI